MTALTVLGVLIGLYVLANVALWVLGKMADSMRDNGRQR